MLKYRISSIGSMFLILILLWGCTTPQSEIRVEGALVAVDSIHAPQKDSLVESVIAGYRGQLESVMNQVLAHSAHRMERGTPEGLLNNFVADLILEQGTSLYQPDDGLQIDFCLLNYGGLRTGIPEGPVTRSRIYELMPFENEMVVITLSPEETMRLFDYVMSANVGMPVSGIRLREEAGEIITSIGSNPFDPQRNYKVLTSDYLAGGGDNMDFFLDPLKLEFLGVKIRDAIIAHLLKEDAAGREIHSELDGRISK